MDKQEVIERLNNKLDEVFAFQRSFEPLTGAYMECESKASAYMIAINYVEQLDEPQKPKTEVFNHDEKFVVEWLDHTTEYHYSLYSALKVAGSEVRSWMKIGFNSNRFARAFMSMDYEVEKEPKWVVKSNRLYFTGITQLIARDPITYNFTTDEKRAHVFDDKESAEKEASFFDGTVEKVEE